MGTFLLLIAFVVIVGYSVYKWWLPIWRSSTVDAKVDELEELDDKFDTVEESKKQHKNVKKKRQAVKKFKKSK